MVEHLPLALIVILGSSEDFLFFKDFILFTHERHRAREREAETQAEEKKAP